MVISSRDGKVDKSTGCLVESTIIKIEIESDTLQEIPMSSRKVGSGISKVIRIPTSPAANIILLLEASFKVSGLNISDLSVLGIFFPFNGYLAIVVKQELFYDSSPVCSVWSIPSISFILTAKHPSTTTMSPVANLIS